MAVEQPTWQRIVLYWLSPALLVSVGVHGLAMVLPVREKPELVKVVEELPEPIQVTTLPPTEGLELESESELKAAPAPGFALIPASPSAAPPAPESPLLLEPEPQPVAPQPVEPQPVEPWPVEPQPIDPQPIDPQPSSSSAEPELPQSQSDPTGSEDSHSSPLSSSELDPGVSSTSPSSGKPGVIRQSYDPTGTSRNEAFNAQGAFVADAFSNYSVDPEDGIENMGAPLKLRYPANARCFTNATTGELYDGVSGSAIAVVRPELGGNLTSAEVAEAEIIQSTGFEDINLFIESALFGEVDGVNFVEWLQQNSGPFSFSNDESALVYTFAVEVSIEEVSPECIDSTG